MADFHQRSNFFRSNHRLQSQSKHRKRSEKFEHALTQCHCQCRQKPFSTWQNCSNFFFWSFLFFEFFLLRACIQQCRIVLVVIWVFVAFMFAASKYAYAVWFNRVFWQSNSDIAIREQPSEILCDAVCLRLFSLKFGVSSVYCAHSIKSHIGICRQHQSIQ